MRVWRRPRLRAQRADRRMSHSAASGDHLDQEREVTRKSSCLHVSTSQREEEKITEFTLPVVIMIG